MKNRKARITIVMALVIALIASSMMVSFAASDSNTKSTTTYNDVIKSGNYAYCSTGKGIYKVNLKTNKVKRIAKAGNAWITPMTMKLYKGYVYYCLGDSRINALYRVKTNGKNKKKIGAVESYAIKGKTIYYTTRDYDYEAEREIILHKQMSLNGANKKNSSYVVSMKIKKSNAKGYRIKHVEKSNGKCTDYLVKPNKKKIKLCTYSNGM